MVLYLFNSSTFLIQLWGLSKPPFIGWQAGEESEGNLALKDLDFVAIFVH